MKYHLQTITAIICISTVANAWVMPTLQKRAVTAQLTVGRSQTPLSTHDGGKILSDALKELCSATGCDEGSTKTTDTFIAQFETFGKKKECKWSVTASGNYDSENERDYMIALLTQSLQTTAAKETIEVTVEQLLCSDQGQPGCETENLEVTSAVNFQQVVLNLDNGANKGELQYKLGVECENDFGFDCPAVVSGNLKDALSSVPGVGPIIAQIFDITCAPS